MENTTKGTHSPMSPRTLALLVAVSAAPFAIRAGDWPAWKCDAGHTASCAEELTEDLHLQWVRQLAKPKTCWPWTQYRLQFDVSYEPVVMGTTLFVPSMVRDSVTAYDTDSGEEKWRFYADGPVRFAPVVWRDKVYFVSDDGYLYCLRADSGRLVWKFRGGPDERKVLGNERLICMWPARGAPVVYDGTIYFAASVWPFMGTFIHALDAQTGKVVWTNSGSSAIFVLQPHASPAFAGVAPQGYLAATEDRLLVAGSRSVPAVYDRHTGKLLHYQANTSKAAGGYDVSVRQRWFFNANLMYGLEAGNRLVGVPASILTDDAIIGVDREGTLVGHALGDPNKRVVMTKDRKGRDRKRTILSPVPLWRVKTDVKLSRAFLLAGSSVFCSTAGGNVVAVSLPEEPAASPEIDATAQPETADAAPALIPRGSEWHYLAGAHPVGAWTALDFDVSSWRTGKAGFGYGDDDDATVLSDMPGKYGCVYVRKTFDVSKAGLPANVGLFVNYDDAFVAYLNGREIRRVGVGAGSGQSAKGIDGHEAKGHEFFPIENLRETLREGKNVLAIEGHNGSRGSSDFTLDPYLAVRTADASPAPAPVVVVPPAWQAEVDGTPWSMLAADGKLFVVTEEGSICCFGPKGGEPTRIPLASRRRRGDSDQWGREAQTLLERTGVTEGYCVLLGVGTGRLAEELVERSNLHIVALGLDEGLADLRTKFDAMGIYGERVHLLSGDVFSVELPPYMASLVASEDLAAMGHDKSGFAERVFHVLRPYGGLACLKLPAGAAASLAKAALPSAKLKAERGYVTLTRVGALPGSADWTHQYGDVANSVCSRDRLVKAPLGLLWFGGPSHTDVLPRHGHGPTQQVVAGRLFIQGVEGLTKQDTYPGIMSARDVYTGRVLWRRTFPKLDTSNMYYNQTYNPDPSDRTYNQRHIPGANEFGSNFVATDELVYLARGEECLVLDGATGRTVRTLELPPLAGAEGKTNWGYIGVYGDLLIAGAVPVDVSKNKTTLDNRYGTGSKYVVAMDRHTGDVQWTHEAALNFRHNTIVAGGGKVFCIDGMSKTRLGHLQRRAEAPEATPKVQALDAQTGEVAWSSSEDVFGTWLGYSEELDILVQAGSRAGDRARDEVSNGMAAYRGKDGTRLWRHFESYGGPPILRHDMIITQTGGGNTVANPAMAFDLRTGERLTRKHHLTGETVPWAWIRFKGCNTAVASEHLMTYRSAAGCYLDFNAGQGTVSIGGFKSGCTSNLVVANGVLNAPDYTRTCLCAYQNQCSFALVHMPDVAKWSYDYYPVPEEPTPVTRVGINFGAPGNRFAPDGTLWVESPSVGGPSPDIPVRADPEQPESFRRHPSHVKGERNWVTASGLVGVKSISIRPFLQPAPKPEPQKEPEPGKKPAPPKKRDTRVKAFLRHAGTQGPVFTGDLAGRFDEPKRYTVRLYFAEPYAKAPGDRVFDVTLQGRKVLRGFDVVRAAGGAARSVVKEFRGVAIVDDLKVSLSPSPNTQEPPLICGLELIAE